MLAGALMSEANYSGANMQEAVLTKVIVSAGPDGSALPIRPAIEKQAYARGAIFDGADLTNGIMDRIDLTDASLRNVKLVNAVITGTRTSLLRDRIGV